MLRGAAEGVAGLIPGADLVTNILRVTHPPREEQERAQWEKDLSQRTNEHTAKFAEHSAKFASLDRALRDVVGAYITANTVHRHASQAGQLSFFRSGMLRSLEAIAVGRGTQQDQERLRELLAATGPEVDDIIRGLSIARDSLSEDAETLEFAHRLDEIIYGPFGKVPIREHIEEVIRTDLSASYLPSLAERICNDIEQFNRAVIALGRSAVRGEAA
ncbi:hypothetical protein A4R29_15000 [Mesorhizobium ciceri biovar biserrulae]|nr:hypothetical protein A4R29_15000 [Mesorhizobium ciceri biovar biserrulae]